MNTFLKSILLFCCCILLLPGTAMSQDSSLLQKPFKPAFRKGSLHSFFDAIYKQTGISVSYSSAAVNEKQKVRISGDEKTVGAVLHELLDDLNLSIAERDNKILIVPADENINNSGPFYPVDGYIKDERNKEILIGASIYIPALHTGTVTNNFGFYSIGLPKGIHTALLSYIGYKTDTLLLRVDGRRRVDVFLRPSGGMLREVRVVSGRKNTPGGDYMQLSVKDIDHSLALLGEHDVMRTLQQQTGVQSGMDGTSGILVRGGDPGQNLNLLDGVPLYYTDHLFGLTSVYNTDAIKSVDFYKGAFPARYGGRLSSIIDVHTQDGDMEHWGGQFSMGLVKSSLTLEGPLIKDRSSIMVSARRTWLDGAFAPFESQVGIFFYDINAKANYILNDDNRLFISFYNGRDQIRYSDDNSYFRTRWGNTMASFKWSSIINPKFFMNTMLTYSQFNYELKDQNQVIDSGLISKLGNYVGVSALYDISLHLQAQWFPNNKHKVEFGGNFSRTYFVPTELESIDTTFNATKNTSSRMLSNELTVYAEDEIKPIANVLIRPGIQWANWYSGQFNYSSVQPRIYASWDLHNKLIYGSFSHMAQFVHLISNNSYGLPTDFWVPSTKEIKPEEAYLYTLGINSSIWGIHYNAEVYYKKIDNTITYTSGKTLFDNSDRWQDKVVQGTGDAYGAELYLDKSWGPLSTSIAYTLSWNWRKFATINNGEAFPYKYDRRHNIKAMATYKVKKGVRFTANWIFMSGEAFTLPDQVYPDFDNNLLITKGSATSTSYTYHYTKWNDYRLPAIHRLDLGIDFVKNKKKSVRTWSLGVFNAYARKNIMFVTLTNDVAQGTLKLQGLSFIQFIPYITYKLKF
ncbi:carboxypeptidase-like regulatory domain-containing protein [Chitinophagaceae bacterium MMS25-I14]